MAVGTAGGGGRQTRQRRRRSPVHGGREGAERLETERKRETDRGVATLAWFGRRWHSAEGRSGGGEEDGRGGALRWLAVCGGAWEAEEAEAGNDEVVAAPGIERGRGKQRRPRCFRDWVEEETEEKGIWEDPEEEGREWRRQLGGSLEIRDLVSG